MFNSPQYPLHRKRRFFFLPVVILLFLLLSALVEWIWNAILPEVTHVGKLDFWQAAGLLLLSRILFGSFPTFGGNRHKAQFNNAQRYMKEKWMGMDENERNRFKEEFRERCRNRKQ